MDTVLTVIGSVVVGVFGGIGLERYRNARKDLEHRQGYYHRLLAAVDAYSDLAGSEYAAGVQEAEAVLKSERQAVEVFGATGVGAAALAVESAVDADDWDKAKTERQRLVTLMRRDVGPRRLGRRV